MSTAIEYPTPAASLPDILFTWEDADGNAIDFSSGWNFTMTIGRPPNPAIMTKTSGFIGLPDAPNLRVSWTSGELSRLTAGVWYFQITATYLVSGQARILTGSLRIDQPVMV